MAGCIVGCIIVGCIALVIFGGTGKGAGYNAHRGGGRGGQPCSEVGDLVRPLGTPVSSIWASPNGWAACVVVNGYRSAARRVGRSFYTCPPPSRVAMASRVSVWSSRQRWP